MREIFSVRRVIDGAVQGLLQPLILPRPRGLEGLGARSFKTEEQQSTGGGGSNLGPKSHSQRELIGALLADSDYVDIAADMRNWAVGQLANPASERSFRPQVVVFKLLTLALALSILEDRKVVLKGFGTFEVRRNTRAGYKHPLTEQLTSPKFSNRISFTGSEWLEKELAGEAFQRKRESLGSSKFTDRLRELFPGVAESKLAKLGRAFLRSTVRTMVAQRSVGFKGLLGVFRVVRRCERTYFPPGRGSPSSTKYPYRVVFSANNGLRSILDRVVSSGPEDGGSTAKRLLMPLLNRYRTMFGLRELRE